MLRRKLVVENIPMRVGSCGQVTIEVKRLCQILVQLQTYFFAGLPAGTGNCDRGARSIIAFVGVQSRESVKFTAGLSATTSHNGGPFDLCARYHRSVARSEH